MRRRKDVNLVTVSPGLQDEHYGIPTSLHGQLGPIALFWEALTPQELIDIHTAGPNNLAMFQPHYTSKKAGSLVGLADKLVLYYNSKASKDHVVLDLVYGKVPTERLDGRLTGHSLSTWNVKLDSGAASTTFGQVILQTQQYHKKKQTNCYTLVLD
eukprot:sb/3473149/